MLLAFEAFVVFFATLVAFGLKVDWFGKQVDDRWVWAVGLTLTILVITTPAVLRGKPGYVWGWVLQVLVTLTGIWVPWMWFLGVVFLCLWAWAMIAGSTIDKARAAFLAQQGQ
jgi:hypothetical protein